MNFSFSSRANVVIQDKSVLPDQEDLKVNKDPLESVEPLDTKD